MLTSCSAAVAAAAPYLMNQLQSPAQPAAVRAAAPAAPEAAAADPLQLLQEAENIRGLLLRNTEELGGLLRALDGAWVPPEAGGDLLRDGPGVLPTGGCLPARKERCVDAYACYLLRLEGGLS
jgi:cobalamin biosynthesis Mg chelatase CobN